MRICMDSSNKLYKLCQVVMTGFQSRKVVHIGACKMQRIHQLSVSDRKRVQLKNTQQYKVTTNRLREAHLCKNPF